MTFPPSFCCPSVFLYSNGGLASSDQNVVLGEYEYDGPGVDGADTSLYRQTGGERLYMYFYPSDGVRCETLVEDSPFFKESNRDMTFNQALSDKKGFINLIFGNVLQTSSNRFCAEVSNCCIL